MASEPKLCGKCGYDLTGLARVGKCPECGESFNQFTGVGVKSHGEVGPGGVRDYRKIKAMVIAGVAVFVGLCSGIVQMIFTQGHAMAIGAVIAAVFLLWALATWMEDRSDRG